MLDRIKSLSLVVSLAAIAVVHGCSKEPKQYDRSAPPNPPQIGSESSGISRFLEEVATNTDSSQISVTADDDLARKNSLKPILYGQGVAGLTFKSKFPETHNILLSEKGTVSRGENKNLIAYKYPEGIVIVWSKDGEQTPLQFVIENGYSGGLIVDDRPDSKLPDTLRSLRIRDDLSAFFESTGDERTSGQRLLRILFNALEKKDDNYDCVATDECHINPLEKLVIFELPRADIMISTDRKTIFRMVLKPYVSRGKLDNNFDLITGKFAGPAAAGSSHTSLGLGSAWKDVYEATNRSEPLTFVLTKSFQKNYSGIVLLFDKSQFSREYTEPNPSEKVGTVAIEDDYQHLLTVNGKYVQISYNNVKVGEEGFIKLSLSDETQEKLSYLTIYPKVEPKHQKEFLTDLLDLLAAEMLRAYPGSKQVKLVSGFYKETKNRKFSARLLSYEAKTRIIRDVLISMNEEQGNLDTVSISESIDAADVESASELMEPLVVNNKDNHGRLAGFAIGQKISLTDIDLARREATVNYKSINDGKPVSTRAAFRLREALVERVYSSKAEIVRESAVSFGALTVRLGLKPVDSKSNDYLITSITVPTLTEVNGLCGLDDYAIKSSEKSTIIKQNLDAALQAAGKATCYLRDGDPKSTNEITTLHFPKDKAALGFDSNLELSTLSIYSKASEVKANE